MLKLRIYVILMFLNLSRCSFYEPFHSITILDDGKDREKVFYLSADFVKTDWYTANLYCQSHGMKLASILTKNEEEALFSYLIKNSIQVKFLWTSLFDKEDTNNFTWGLNGPKVNYTLKWHIGSEEPDLGRNHRCGHLSFDNKEQYAWNDFRCDHKFNFLCEVITSATEETKNDYEFTFDVRSQTPELKPKLKDDYTEICLKVKIPKMPCCVPSCK